MQEYPTHVPTWINILKKKVEAKEDPQEVFEKCLVKLNDVSVWRFYLQYIIANNSESYETIVAAYEYTLQHVGLDYYSDSLWDEYIKYLQQSSHQQAKDQLLSVFQKCVVIPLNNLDQFWRQFEQSFPDSVGDRSALYINARSKCKSVQNFVDAVPKHSLCREVNGPKDYALVKKLRDWVQFEVSNPMNYQQLENVVVRVCYAYTYSLNNFMYKYPSVWIEYLLYCSSTSVQDCQSIAQDALNACPMAVQLNVVIAELFLKFPEKFGASTKKEQKGMLESCKQLFESLIKRYEDALTEQKQKISESIESGQDEQAIDLLQDQEQEMADLCIGVWVQYLRFVKRSDDSGASQKTTRLIFSRARKTSYAESSPSAEQLFTTSALMEYWGYGDKVVSFKIFEVGLQRFKSLSYVCTYMDHLLISGDISNARALFERLLSQQSQEDAIHLWQRMLSWESQFGTLLSLQSLEQRFFSIYSYSADSEWIGQRLCYDLQHMYEKECGISLPLMNLYTLSPSMVSSSENVKAPMPTTTGTDLTSDFALAPTRDVESQYKIVSNAISIIVPKSNVIKPDLKSNFRSFQTEGRTNAQVGSGASSKFEDSVSSNQQFPQQSQQSAYIAPQLVHSQYYPNLPYLVEQFVTLFPQVPLIQQLWQGPLLNGDMVLDIIANAPVMQPVGYVPGQPFVFPSQYQGSAYNGSEYGSESRAGSGTGRGKRSRRQ